LPRPPSPTLFPYTTLFRSATYGFEHQDGGYIGEFQNFHEAIVHGAPVVGTLGQSIRGMEIITKALLAAESGEVVTLDNSPKPLSDRKSTRLNSSHVKISYA